MSDRAAEVVAEYREHLKLLRRTQTVKEAIAALSFNDLYLKGHDDDFFVFSHTREGYFACETTPEACLEKVRALVGATEEDDEA